MGFNVPKYQERRCDGYMREITIGDKKVRVRATPLALLYYRQEFKRDLLGDFFKMSEAAKDPSKIDVVALLQVVWAMAKADSCGKQFPGFEQWLAQLDEIDLSDNDFLAAALEEAADGFLGRNKKPPAK